MPDRSQHPLDRLGAAAGIAFVALFVAIVTVGSALPAPEHSIAQIQLAARHKRDGILLGAYLGLLLSGALLVFGAAITARQWRAERAGEG